MADTTEALRLLDQLREEEYKSGMHRTPNKAQQAQHTANLLRAEIERLADAHPSTGGMPREQVR